MDKPCSSSSQYKGLVPRWELAPIHEKEGQHHHLCNGNEWLSSSASSSAAGAASKIDAYPEDNDDDHKSQRGGGICGETLIEREREHMFDKVVTPSDVGKLNRLVIPKQHAEKYFPLDPFSNEKGLLLNFEDRTGKPWRFRYSYWNSSQSYVITKGWSRFVKDKKLDAGDIISFQRCVGENGNQYKLFIDWRRRPLLPPPPPPSVTPAFSLYHHHHHHYHQQYHRSVPAAAWTPTFLFRSHPHPSPQSQGTVWDHPSSSHFPPATGNVIDRASSHSHPHWRGTSSSTAGPGAGHYACGFGARGGRWG